MLKEFRDFVARGNVIDMAVGIIIGAAFTSIVNSLVKDIINPLIGLFTGGVDFSDFYLNFSGTPYESLAAAQESGAATLNYGLFINAVINFLIVAFVVFILVKKVNRIKDMAQKTQKKEVKTSAPPAVPADVALLTEIRDLLAGQKKKK